MHPGRGHTAGDLVVRVPDVDVVIAGDLVEESAARGHVPGFGRDCYPFEWPQTLDVALDLITLATVVVPGHGAVIDREFVEVQRNDIGILAETIRDLASRGVPVDEALGVGRLAVRPPSTSSTPSAVATSTCRCSQTPAAPALRRPGVTGTSLGTVGA